MSSANRQSTLEGHLDTGKFGAEGASSPRVALQELRPGAIAQINGAPEEGELDRLLKPWRLAEAIKPNRAACAESRDLLWNGPGKWMVVSQSDEPEALLSSLESILSGTNATVTDLSHARTVIRVTGEAAADVLCKGCPADIESMQSGDCIVALVGTLSAVIHCREPATSFDAYVFRSFGQAFWEWITDGAAEYGYSVS